MAVTKLSKVGENYIRSKVNGSGNSFLSGKASDKYGSVEANPTKVLPYCYPLTNVNAEWTSNSTINGGITTNDELANALIRWYNKYATEFSMDANIMMAQAVQESGLKVWNYAVNGTASGISQFVDNTFYAAIVQNKRGNFTDAEIQALTTGMIDYTYQPGAKVPQDPFFVKYLLGRKNRPIIHQNIVNNPEIMIKAQFEYMKHISGYCKSLASSTLFRYNRGLITLKVTSSYSEIIEAAKNYSTGYENEGINYVFRIFESLYKNFGYKELDITDAARDSFDKFNASLG